MNAVLREYIDRFWVVYMDDILAYSTIQEEQYTNLELILYKFEVNKLYFSHEKCSFMETEVKFLGIVVAQTGLQVIASRAKSV